MFKRASFLSIALFILCFSFFCKSKSTVKLKKIEDKGQQKLDSNKSDLQSKNNSDTSFLKKFDLLNSYFNPDTLGHTIDEEKVIPFSVISNFLSVDEYDTTGLLFINVNPVCSFKNYDGFFFIVKVNCTAGAICATYYLLSFDTVHKFVNHKVIGEETGEESESYIIKHKFVSETVLQIDKIRYDNINDRIIDSTIKRFKLKS